MSFTYHPGDHDILVEAFLTLPPEWVDVILDEYLTVFPIAD